MLGFGNTSNVTCWEAVNIYSEAYDLLREILDDEALNNFVYEETGKYLALIEAGAQTSIPAAKITFTGGEISCSDNIMQVAGYNVAFMLPFWGADALKQSHDFMDVAVHAFFDHELRSNPVRINRVIRLTPSITEFNEESELWTVAFDVAVSIFI